MDNSTLCFKQKINNDNPGLESEQAKKNTSEGRSAMAAFRSYTQGCFGENFGHFPNKAMTCAKALRQMNHTEGLLFESLRAMEIQVPFVLSSSKSCWQANVAAAHEGRPGRCVNVLLDDDTMVDLAAALKSHIGPAWKLSKSDMNAMASKISRCNVTSMVNMTKKA